MTTLSTEILGTYSEDFNLSEKDDIVLQLVCRCTGNVVAVFNQMVTTVKEIREVCRELKGE